MTTQIDSFETQTPGPVAGDWWDRMAKVEAGGVRAVVIDDAEADYPFAPGPIDWDARAAAMGEPPVFTPADHAFMRERGAIDRVRDAMAAGGRLYESLTVRSLLDVLFTVAQEKLHAEQAAAGR